MSIILYKKSVNHFNALSLVSANKLKLLNHKKSKKTI